MPLCMLLQLHTKTIIEFRVTILLPMQFLKVLIYFVLLLQLVLVDLSLELVLLQAQVVNLGCVEGGELVLTVHLNYYGWV